MTFNQTDKVKALNNKTYIPEGEYVTKRQAAALLDIDVTTVQYHIKQSNLPSIHIGNLHIIHIDDVINFNPPPQGRPKNNKE